MSVEVDACGLRELLDILRMRILGRRSRVGRPASDPTPETCRCSPDMRDTADGVVLSVGK